jgi:hypothetical protein
LLLAGVMDEMELTFHLIHDTSRQQIGEQYQKL